MKKKLLCLMLIASLLIPSMPVKAQENQAVVEMTETTEIDASVDNPDVVTDEEISEVTDADVEEEISEVTDAEAEEEISEVPDAEAEEEVSEVTDVESEEEVSESAEVETDEVLPETTEVETEEVISETTEVETEEVIPETTETEEVTLEVTETEVEEETAEPEQIEAEEEVLKAVEINIEEVEAVATSVAEMEAQTEEWYVNPSYRDEYSESDIREMASQQSEDEVLTAGYSATVSSDAEAAQKIRAAMKARMSPVNLTFSYKSSLSMTSLILLAVKDDGSGAADEGDYIMHNTLGYGGYCGSTGCSLNFTYASTASQESAVNTAVKQAIASLNLGSKSDYQKIKAIHDYIVNHVTYVNDGTTECHGTYAALVKGKAVCQGYATLFYRMCREVGIPAKYISGTAGGGHGWNIVKLGNVWYNVDTTWDDPDNGTIDYTYFLKADIDFGDHYRSEEYRTSSFYASFPMAAVSYGEEVITKLNLNNSINKTYSTVDGKTISTQSNGKPKILVIFGYNCGNSKSTLRSFDASTWAASGKVDVCAVDVRMVDKATITDFRDEYCPNGNVEVGYCTNYAATNAFWDYRDLAGTESTTLPLIAMIDANNKLQFVTNGYLSEKKVNKVYLPLLIDGWVPTADAVTNPITSIKIRRWPALEYIDSYPCTDLENGSTVTLKAGENLFVKGIGVPKDKTYNLGIPNTDTTFTNSNGAVAVYDASTGVLNAISAGSTKLTFTSVTNPEVKATLNIVVTGNGTGSGSVSDPSLSGWPFADVAQSGWKYNGVKYVYDNGIMKGVGDGTSFDPDAPVTREMFATVLYRIAGEPAVAYKNKFPDVPGGKWYSNAVIWASEQKIVSGYTNGKFGTGDYITREQMAKMLMEYANYKGHGTGVRANLGRFADKSTVSTWATDYMKWAVGCGMISGSTQNGYYYLKPKGQATRAECATMLSRFVPTYG